MLLMDGFNEECSNIASGYLNVGDESMSAMQFRTMSKGDLPHLYYISQKPEPLGTEFNTVAWSVRGALIFLEIQRGKEGMKSGRYHLELGAADACTKRLMEETKGLGQRASKGSTRYCFLFSSWFYRKKEAETAASIGVDLISMVKTNTKGFFKAKI